jgi:hypothetical protein
VSEGVKQQRRWLSALSRPNRPNRLQGDYYEAVCKAIDPAKKEMVACFPKDAGEGQVSFVKVEGVRACALQRVCGGRNDGRPQPGLHHPTDD